MTRTLGITGAGVEEGVGPRLELFGFRFVVPICHPLVRTLGFRRGRLRLELRLMLRLRLGAREPAPRRRWRWLLGWCLLLGFREDGEGSGLFFFLGGLFRGGIFSLPKEERGNILRERRRLNRFLDRGFLCGGARLFLVGLFRTKFRWRLRRGIRPGAGHAARFRLFPAAETAAAEAAVEEAASGGDVSFVLLLPPVDACAEASKKDNQGDDYCW